MSQPTEKTLPTYLSLEQAAQITEQSVKTIRRRIADGTLPAYRFGGRSIRIKLERSRSRRATHPHRRHLAKDR